MSTMTTEQGVRFVAERVDGDWTVVKVDATGRQGLGTFPSREAARADAKARTEAAKQSPVTGEQVRTSPVLAALSEGARETVAVNADARIEDSVDPAEADLDAQVTEADMAKAAETADGTSADLVAKTREAVAERLDGQGEQGDEQPAGEQGGQATGESEGASTEDVIEEVRKLHALTKLSPAALGKLIEDEPQVLLDAMDAVRTALASRTRVRVYASHLTSGQRIELRGVGVVTVADVVKVASRRVLLQWTDGEGKPGEREVSSWQWTTLA